MHRIELYIMPAFMLAALSASAQDIDPTVEVSRIYQGKMIEVHKPMIEMQVPDSVTRFDLDFDYSVFDNPYKGTYEFNPYVQNMKPQPDAGSGRRLFIKAGAGYPLHPVFDLVWSPGLKGRFRMSTYVTHRSYVGRYRNISPVSDQAAGKVYLDSFQDGTGPDKGWKGHDLSTRAGVDGSVSWGSGVFSFDVGYYGLATGDTLTTRGYNALDARVRVRSEANRERYFLYDIDAAYRYGADRLDRSGFSGQADLSGHEFSFKSALGPVFSKEQRLTAAIGFDMVSYGNVFGTMAGKVSLNPKYSLDKGRWRLGLGVLFSAMFNSGADGLLPSQYSKKGQYVYPDISVGYELVRNYMELYAALGGGDRLGKYSDMLGRFHFITPLYTYGVSGPLLDNTVERISASAGLRGNIASRFTYDLSAGYRNFSSVPLYAVVSGSGRLEPGYFMTLAYTGMQMFYASLDYGWKSDAFSLDGNFTYRNTAIRDNGVRSVGQEGVMAFFAPASFSGNVRAMYNWHRRVYAGADCDLSLARHSSLCSIGSYADLGIYVEVRTAGIFSFWLRGGNMLNMTVQRAPAYAESGINFTMGICLNL